MSAYGGSIGALNGTGSIRTVSFTPTANTNNLAAAISVIAGSYTDAVGNAGAASNTLNLTADTQAPTVTISSDRTSLTAGDTTMIRFNFSEDPTGFEWADIIVSGGSLESPQGTGQTRTALFTPTANSNALNASISVAAYSYTDAVGNSGQASNPLNLTADTQAPTLTISSDRTSLKAGDTATLTFNFSELPTGFDFSDIAVTGGTLGMLNGSGQTRTALFTPTANSNNLNASISVAANAYTDTVGNPGTASAPLTLVLDTTLPTLTLTGATLQEGNSGTTNASLTVNLSAASGQTVTVNYATQDGTAQANSDYTRTSGTLIFNPGETRKTIQVPVLGDTTVEGDENFQMLLSTATSALLNPNAASSTVQISNDDVIPVSTYTKGQAVIDLGSQYGKLINPVTVDGGRVYYYWDVSGDGTSSDTKGAGYANSRDYVTHDWLDELFRQDVNGRTGGDGNTDNTYRYATLNGVKLALPTIGNGDDFISRGETGDRNGTAVQGTANNPTYDDYLAIWDAYNGTGTGMDIALTPPGWGDNGLYWSATPAASGHAFIYLYGGYVDYYYVGYGGFYVAVEVL